MGFLKYLGKDIVHSVNKWWNRQGLVYFIGVFFMALVISAGVFAPEHVQQIIITILLVLSGIILLAAVVLATCQVVDWLRDKYKEYKGRE